MKNLKKFKKEKKELKLVKMHFRESEKIEHELEEDICGTCKQKVLISKFMKTLGVNKQTELKKISRHERYFARKVIPMAKKRCDVPNFISITKL